VSGKENEAIYILAPIEGLIINSARAMNEKSRLYVVILSCLLIPTITVFVIAMGEFSNDFARNLINTSMVDKFHQELVASTAKISAEVNLPIYDERKVHDNVNLLAEERMQDQATAYSAATEALLPRKYDNKDAWNINIASLATKINADKLVENAREKGIDATQKYVAVNGKKYWRISVKGFLSQDDARTHSILVKDLLGLKDVWISKEAEQS